MLILDANSYTLQPKFSSTENVVPLRLAWGLPEKTYAENHAKICRPCWHKLFLLAEYLWVPECQWLTALLWDSFCVHCSTDPQVPLSSLRDPLKGCSFSLSCNLSTLQAYPLFFYFTLISLASFPVILAQQMPATACIYHVSFSIFCLPFTLKQKPRENINKSF